MEHQSVSQSVFISGKAHKNSTERITKNHQTTQTQHKHRVLEGNLDNRGIWTLGMFKTSYLFSVSHTQFMKTVSGSFDSYV